VSLVFARHGVFPLFLFAASGLFLRFLPASSRDADIYKRPSRSMVATTATYIPFSAASIYLVAYTIVGILFLARHMILLE
jgi:hypothetical protein